MTVYVIAEVGINHNGDVEIAKNLIDVAVDSGCNAVKFQKRDIERVYSPEQLDSPRESPYGKTTRQQKLGIEFEEDDYDIISDYCNDKKIDWFFSAWDLSSQDFIKKYNLKYNKIASPMLTVSPLVEKVAAEKKPTFISTGMSTLAEIDKAVEIFRSHECPFELMHCVSNYPMPNDIANLRMMDVLRDRYECKVGYSGHEKGLQISLAAVARGATSIERHITLDRTMYGSDQSASLEPEGLKRLVRDIRTIEAAMGNGEKRISQDEQKARDYLAHPYWYSKGNS